MRVVSRKGLAEIAAKRWKNQYYSRGAWGRGRIMSLGEPEAIYEGLVALGDNPDPDDVDRIIGNKSWTYVCCNECNKSCESVIELGQEPDYESSTAHVCKACLKAAVKLL